MRIGCGLLYVVALTLAMLTMLAGCKTTEKNYREAYERATAKNDRDVTDFDKTVYSRYRNQVRERSETTGDGREIPTKVVSVRVTEDGGGIREWFKKYNVVVAEFKQIFNANSLRRRFADAGYPRAFLVENAEPYYYVVVASSSDLEDMVAVCDSLKADSPFPLKDGFPYILSRP